MCFLRSRAAWGGLWLLLGPCVSACSGDDTNTAPPDASVADAAGGQDSATQADASGAGDGAPAADAAGQDATGNADGSGGSDASGASDGNGGTDGGGGDGASDATPPTDSGADADAALPQDAGPPLDAAALNGEADDAVEALMLNLWSQGNGYLVDSQGGANASYATFAEAWEAVLGAAQRHNDQRFVGTLHTLYNAQGNAGWTPAGVDFDDQVWMILALIRAYDLTGETNMLAQAQTLYANVQGAWDSSSASSGGIWSDAAHTQKATAGNVGAVIAGARLYARTSAGGGDGGAGDGGDGGDAGSGPAYLEFAKQVYAYWTANMIDATTHQVTDHVSSGGTKSSASFTFDQGLVIGAALELSSATGDASYLTLAHQVAQYMVANQTAASSAGTILSDGTSAACAGDCPRYKGIAASALAAVYAADASHSEYVSLLSASTTAAWTIARDPTSHLYGADWGAAFQSPGRLAATSSAALGLSAVAALAGAPLPDTANLYEAEEGVLHSLGLEASNLGYTGWGYVAGWGSDGQWVDFFVNAPTAHTYDLTFRYASSGGASRLVFVDSANVVVNQAFPDTGAWGTYQTVVVPAVALAQGKNTVSLIFNQGDGSSGYINLDNLTIAQSP